MLTNVMENVARRALQNLIERGYDGCTCERCQNDILAIALNHLPPQYSASPAGEVYIKAKMLEDQAAVDVMQELARAMEIVREHKRHA
ncbi:late competence development ComFB family protein [Sulfoacidibacillus thermotolerans]|uniref:Competence protein ComFB n=1 Tax=Sulfoacidibacillus thermotolerans TaxID=1765684 RepID=A0A2U3D8V8_SULT2|nr:late competence development ComFB family protein [Sulfoacidibacillus thermotolerans]PWI57713.1 hypothetical protein BM613_06925 [Sulfoacidibacillus thermotolerans]